MPHPEPSPEQPAVQAAEQPAEQLPTGEAIPLFSPSTHLAQHSLSDFGTNTYLMLVALRRPTRRALLAEGIPEADVDQALTVLHAAGLIDATDPERLIVHPPDVAMNAYAAALERQAASTRAASEGLAQVYHRVRSEGGDDVRVRRRDARVLPDRESMLDAYREVVTSAHRDLLWYLAAGSTLVANLFDLSPRRHLHESVPEEVRLRVTVDRTLLTREGAYEALAALAERGFEVRIGIEVGASFVVADDHLALLDLAHTDPEGTGSILVSQRAQVALIRRMCERAFTQGAHLPHGPAQVTTIGLDDRDTKVLALLAAGAADGTIARQLRISQRTVERRVQGLMLRLGATSRFQAGVQAARRGLI